MSLYIVATPIGNLDDITIRAVKTLKSVDLIVCENVNHSKRLLNFFDIDKPLLSWHQHSRDSVLARIVDLLADDKDLAYITDAGTPGISDPGSRLVSEVFRRLDDQVSIVPIPGVSALTAALSIAGVPTNTFSYWGYVPHKKGRQQFIRGLAVQKQTIIFFESVYRIRKLLDSFKEIIPDRQIIVARELTKQYETIYRGSPEDVADSLMKDKIKGEFVVIVSPY